MAEEFFDISELELHISRTAMIVLAGMRRWPPSRATEHSSRAIPAPSSVTGIQEPPSRRLISIRMAKVWDCSECQGLSGPEDTIAAVNRLLGTLVR